MGIITQFHCRYGGEKDWEHGGAAKRGAAASPGGESPAARPEMILTPDQRVRVFISSTLGELAAERAAARRAIGRLHLVPVWYESGARPYPPRSMYRAYLEQSQVFVGIYWQRSELVSVQCGALTSPGGSDGCSSWRVPRLPGSHSPSRWPSTAGSASATSTTFIRLDVPATSVTA